MRSNQEKEDHENDEECEMKPYFSVVIPVYNVENYLQECIDSVLRQENITDLTTEIILVNDGSTDNSGKLCDEYKKKYNQIKVIHQENKGLLQARRAGYKVVNGEYIINLDSDDFLLPNALNSIRKVSYIDHYDVIFYNISIMDDSGIKPLYSDVFSPGDGCQIAKDQVIQFFFQANIPIISSMCGKAIRKDCLNMYKDYSEYGKLSTGEDTLQTAEIISNAEKFYYLNKSLYVYRMGSGMTSRFDPDYYSYFKKILNDITKQLGYSENDKYFKDLYYEKILAIGCMAIRQSKFDKRMTFKERKTFLKLLEMDEDLKVAMKKSKIIDLNIKPKLRLLMQLFKMRAYFPIHLFLKITR